MHVAGLYSGKGAATAARGSGTRVRSGQRRSRDHCCRGQSHAQISPVRLGCDHALTGRVDMPAAASLPNRAAGAAAGPAFCAGRYSSETVSMEGWHPKAPHMPINTHPEPPPRPHSMPPHPPGRVGHARRAQRSSCLAFRQRVWVGPDLSLTQLSRRGGGKKASGSCVCVTIQIQRLHPP